MGTSTLKDPSYTFDYGGTQKVALTVTGPGGSDTKVHDVLSFWTCKCPYWEVPSIYAEAGINYFRDNNIVQNLPTIKVYNNFSSAVIIRTYDPESWLNGEYDNIRGQRTIHPGATETISSSIMTNEWGMQLIDVSGAISCVRLIARIGYDNGSAFIIRAEDIIDGQR